jgi:hypothetical protein
MKNLTKLILALVAMSFTAFTYAGDKPADKKDAEKKECCGCAECKECKIGDCCCKDKEKKSDEKQPEKK